jgi:hypothetical protein
MRRVIRLLFHFLFSVLPLAFLAGCVTHPSPTLVQPWPGRPPEGYATLLYYGDGGHASFYVDNTRAFKMLNNGYTWVYVRAGDHTIHTKWNFLMSGMNASGDFAAVAGKTYYLKSILGNGNSNPWTTTIGSAMGLVPEKLAKQEAPTHWYYKPFVQQIDSVATNSPAASNTSH